MSKETSSLMEVIQVYGSKATDRAVAEGIDVTEGAAHVLQVVIADDGTALPLESLAQSFNWNGDGTLHYTEVSYGGNTYRQTLAYAGGKLASQSAWVKQ